MWPHPGLRVSRFYCHFRFSNDLYILDPSIQEKKLLIFRMLSKVISHFVVMYFLIKRVFMFYLIYILLHCFYVEFTYFLDKHPWSGNMDRLTLHMQFYIMISQSLLYYLYYYLIYNSPILIYFVKFTVTLHYLHFDFPVLKMFCCLIEIVTGFLEKSTT